jgi:hypothetical protein
LLDSIIIPHIRYLADTEKLNKIGIYIGSDGELINGEKYDLYTVSYAKNPDDKRSVIWAARHVSGNTVYHINLNDFQI